MITVPSTKHPLANMQNANIYGDPVELWLGAPDQPAVDIQHIILCLFFALRLALWPSWPSLVFINPLNQKAVCHSVNVVCTATWKLRSQPRCTGRSKGDSAFASPRPCRAPNGETDGDFLDRVDHNKAVKLTEMPASMSA